MRDGEGRRLSATFSKYVRIDAALDEESLDDAFRLRHEVFCRDFGFLPAQVDRRETDADDTHSMHCVVRTSDVRCMTVGCIRVVLTDPSDPAAPLQIERACVSTLDRSIMDPAKLPRDTIAEFSRLTVQRRYRAGAPRDRQVDVDDWRRLQFVIPISLLLGAFVLASHRRVETAFSLSEPLLVAHLDQLGLGVRQIGRPTSYHGIRVPLAMQVHPAIAGLDPLIQPLWETVQAQITPSLGADAERH